MISVLQVLPALGFGGVERGTIDVANELITNGYGSYILSSGGVLESKLKKGVIAINYTKVKSKNPINIIKTAFFISKIVKDYDIKIIHARSRAQAWSSYVAYLINKRRGVRFVTTFHGLYKMPNFFKKAYNSGMVTGERIIATSEYTKDYILKFYPSKKDKITVINRWVDTKEFNPDTYDSDYIEQIKSEYKISNEKIVFLPGRMSRLKGHHFLIRSASLLQRTDIVIVLMGEKGGKIENEIISLASDLGLKTRLIILPYTQKISSLYKMSDIVVCPSVHHESFGRTVIEACAMKKPVIATDLGPFKYTIIDGKTGWLVKVDDTQSMSAIIDKVLSMKKNDLHDVCEAAHRYVNDNFSLEVIMKKKMKFYSDFCNKYVD